jgi:acetylxylan esterase
MLASHRRFGSRAVGLLLLGSLSSVANAGTAVQVTNFGPNPTGIGMYLYTPTNVVAKPPILVGIHACHGKGLDVCSSGNTFAQQADKYGFLLVCPSAVSSDGCWDVHSTASLSHDGGGDAGGIISMVNYVVTNKNGDASRVYAAGHSSGAMMTNVLLGSYPDVFKAGAAFAGVPFACFAQGSIDNLGWSSTCAQGKVTMTGDQWGALVRAAYPGFTGKRPRMQLWHGTTDDILLFHNFGEEVKEWTNVLGVSETPTATENDALRAGWIRTRYADSTGVVRVEAVQETGQPHNLVVNGAEAIRFFGLDGSNPEPEPAGGSSSSGGAAGASGSPVGGSGGATGGATAASGAGGMGGAGGASNVPSLGGAGGMTAIVTAGTATAVSTSTGGSAGASSTNGLDTTARTDGSASSCAFSGAASPHGLTSRLLLLAGIVVMGVRRRRELRAPA